MKKVIFLGAKQVGYECFSFLVDNAAANNYEVAGLITNSGIKRYGSGADLREIAAKANVPVLNDLASLQQIDYDILISVQYHEILKKEHIETAKEIAVNLHMAPLPEYRGCNQFTFAIIDGVEEFGTTIHQMTPGIDSGDIIFERRFAVDDNVFVEQLYNKTYEETILLFKESLPKLVSGDYTLQPQSNYTDRKKGFHLRNEINEAKKLDLSWPKDKVERHIRATAMPGFEGPYFMIGDKKIKLELEQ